MRSAVCKFRIFAVGSADTVIGLSLYQLTQLLAGMQGRAFSRSFLNSFVEEGCRLAIQLLELFPGDDQRDPSRAIRRHLETVDPGRARMAEVQLGKTNQQRQGQ